MLLVAVKNNFHILLHLLRQVLELPKSQPRHLLVRQRKLVVGLVSHGLFWLLSRASLEHLVATALQVRGAFRVDGGDHLSCTSGARVARVEGKRAPGLIE